MALFRWWILQQNFTNHIIEYCDVIVNFVVQNPFHKVIGRQLPLITVLVPGPTMAAATRHQVLQLSLQISLTSAAGGGEHLIKTFLAKTCADSVQKEPNASLAVSSAFKDNFLESEFLSHVEDKHGGVLVLKHLMEDDGYREAEVLWAHTTDSMCVGYMLETHSKPTTFISRLPASSLPGKSFAMEGKNFKL